MVSFIIKRLVLPLVIYAAAAEFALRYLESVNAHQFSGAILHGLVNSIFYPYFGLKFRLLHNRIAIPFVEYGIPELWLWLVVLCVSLLLGFFIFRRLIDLWNRFLGLFDRRRSKIKRFDFHSMRYDLLKALSKFKHCRQSKQQIFLGLNQKKHPHFFNPTARTMQTQLIGKTGSGKSTLIETMLFQDLLAGRGAIILDGKGELSFAEKIYAMAKCLKREDDVLIFSLAFPRKSCGYNPFYIHNSDDVLPTAQRVFSVFDMEEPYFRQQSESYFVDLVKLLYGTGKEFTFQDLYRCIVTNQAFDEVSQQSKDRQAGLRIQRQMERLGRDGAKTLSGLESWLRKFSGIAPLNEYQSASSIHLESAIKQNKIVYFQLPGAFQQIFSSAVGKIVLQDIQMEIAKRQFSEKVRPHFPVYVDEFYNFAYEGFMDAINKGRSANFMWTLAHQSMSDLTRVSEEFAQGVWDNTRNKIILSQNNHELCEKISKDIGTNSIEERTIRETLGLLWTVRKTGEGSNKRVDEFIFNPNSIKSLKPYGQGYFITERYQVGLNFPYLELPKIASSIFDIANRKKTRCGLNNGLGLDDRWSKSEQQFLKQEDNRHAITSS